MKIRVSLEVIEEEHELSETLRIAGPQRHKVLRYLSDDMCVPDELEQHLRWECTWAIQSLVETIRTSAIDRLFPKTSKTGTGSLPSAPPPADSPTG